MGSFVQGVGELRFGLESLLGFGPLWWQKRRRPDGFGAIRLGSEGPCQVSGFHRSRWALVHLLGKMEGTEKRNGEYIDHPYLPVPMARSGWDKNLEVKEGISLSHSSFVLHVTHAAKRWIMRVGRSGDTRKRKSSKSHSYCGWTKSCTTFKPWETIVCWYLQGNHPSFQGVLGGAGLRPSTVSLSYRLTWIARRLFCRPPDSMSPNR